MLIQHPTRNVKDFMTRKVITVNERDSALDICRLMAEKSISCVIVVKGRKPAGIITERDVIKRIAAQPKDVRVNTAAFVMTSPVYCVSEETSLLQAEEIIQKKGIRRLVIVTPAGILRGVITQTDITRALSETLVDKLRDLREIQERTKHLFIDTMEALSQTLDARDRYTGTHSKNVAHIVLAISEKMKLEDARKRDIYLAGLFHDIGKIEISDLILNKKGKLTDAEYDIIKYHPIASEEILRPIKELENILPTIRHHHERYDGSGYPDGIRGDKIPYGSRIIAVADCYDAMTTTRCYRKAFSRREALAEMRKQAGRQFDPDIAGVFQSIKGPFARSRREIDPILWQA